MKNMNKKWALTSNCIAGTNTSLQKHWYIMSFVQITTTTFQMVSPSCSPCGPSKIQMDYDFPLFETSR